MRRNIVSSALAAIVLAGVSQAHAGPIYDPTVSTCTGANCSSIVLGGSLFSLGSGSAGQWVQEVFARAGQCVRVQVLSEFTDLAMDVVAPGGAIYSDDQGGVAACPNCPNVKIARAPKTGWYTVNVAQYLGNPAEGNFTLAYGTYPAGNANCSSPTPVSMAPAAARSERGGDVAPKSGPSSR